MSIRTIDWVTPTWISCAEQLLCGSANTMSVILCLVAGKAIDSPAGLPQGTILAALTKVVTVPNACGGAVSYRYTFSYQDDQTGATILVAADITGVICDGCFTSWVRDMVGISDIAGGAFKLGGVVTDRGDDSGHLFVSTAEVPLPNLALSATIFNDPDIFGGRSLMLEAVLKTSIGFDVVAGTLFEFFKRATVDGVVGGWADQIYWYEQLPVGSRMKFREQRSNVELVGDPLYPPLVPYPLLPGDTCQIDYDFKAQASVLNVCELYACATELFVRYWAI